MQADDQEILNYLNDVDDKLLFTKKRANVKEIEQRLKRQMKNVGFGLRDIKLNMTGKNAEKQFEQICTELDKTHNRFKEVLYMDKSLDRDLIEKHYGLTFSEKLKRMQTY